MARTSNHAQRVMRERRAWADDDCPLGPVGPSASCCKDREPIDDGVLHQAAHSECPCSARAEPSLRIDEQSPQELGRKGEDIAAYYLRSRGWDVLERNWTCPYGEADIIACDDGEVVFVEVKTRLDHSRRPELYPEIAVDERKRLRYRNMMEHYARVEACDRMRFDVRAVSVVGERTARIHHLVDALEA